MLNKSVVHPRILFLKLITGWTVGGSIRVEDEIFRARPDRNWAPPTLLYDGYGVFPGGKKAGTWKWPPTPSNAEVTERVKLDLYSPSGPSWPDLRWIFYLYINAQIFKFAPFLYTMQLNICVCFSFFTCFPHHHSLHFDLYSANGKQYNSINS